MNHTQECGRLIEDLSDYLDTGTSTDAEHFEHCPYCQARLAGLRSLNAVALELLDDDVATASAEDAGWLDGILANLTLDSRAGRSIPLKAGTMGDSSETAGSVIAMVRDVGESLGGVLIGRCRLNGEVDVPGAPVVVSITVSARYGHHLPSLAQELRAAVVAQLLLQTELNITAVNVAFTNLRPPLGDEVAGSEEGRA